MSATFWEGSIEIWNEIMVKMIPCFLSLLWRHLRHLFKNKFAHLHRIYVNIVDTLNPSTHSWLPFHSSLVPSNILLLWLFCVAGINFMLSDTSKAMNFRPVSILFHYATKVLQTLRSRFMLIPAALRRTVDPLDIHRTSLNDTLPRLKPLNAQMWDLPAEPVATSF